MAIKHQIYYPSRSPLSDWSLDKKRSSSKAPSSCEKRVGWVCFSLGANSPPFVQGFSFFDHVISISSGLNARARERERAAMFYLCELNLTLLGKKEEKDRFPPSSCCLACFCCYYDDAG